MVHGAVATESLARWFCATRLALQGTRRDPELAFPWQSNETASAKLGFLRGCRWRLPGPVSWVHWHTSLPSAPVFNVFWL
jgi:hypothetical protein